MEPLDQYILTRTAELDATIRRAYDALEFHRAYQALNEFINTDLSALYLDVIKDRLYTFAPNAPARRSAQTALWRIAEALTRLIAPILSFTADEVWAQLPAVPPTANPASTSPSSPTSPTSSPATSSPAPLSTDLRRPLAKRRYLLACVTAFISSLSRCASPKLIGKALECYVTNSPSPAGSPEAPSRREVRRSIPELFGVSSRHPRTRNR